MDQAVHGQKGDTGEMTVAYAAYHQDRDIRMNSSSGGVFYALAAEVIRDGGVVFGVRFDNLFHAVCDAAETLEDLIRFQGSKYVYPDLRGVDARIRGFLEQGRTVLFTGLPCHAAGMRGSLMRQGCRTERLICVDVVCHGTPAPGVWESYLRYESERGNGIAGIRMRDKTAGNRFYSGFCFLICEGLFLRRECLEAAIVWITYDRNMEELPEIRPSA